MSENIKVIPVIPLRDIVVYPNMTIPLNVGRKRSISAIRESSRNHNNFVILATQKESSASGDYIENIFNIITLAKIIQMTKLPDGTYKIIVDAVSKQKVLEYSENNNCLFASINELTPYEDEKIKLDNELKAVVLSLSDLLKKYSKLDGHISKDILVKLITIKNPQKFIYEVASLLRCDIEKKQRILEADTIKEKGILLLSCLNDEIEILELEIKIKNRVKAQVDKNQKEYYLNEQVKAIYKELGDVDEESEVSILKKKIEDAKMSEEAKEKCLKELKKLKSMPASSSESAVSRNYIETVLSLPWGKKTKIKTNISTVEKILNKEHYGIHKVKERILEHLAVQLRKNDRTKSPILCLVGPPGVGKTSIGQSIANATGREYVRMALGGVRDESEIRGHRRTYIGSMPGQIIQKITKSKVENPLFLLDEIDKISADFRGDPSAALLEVLDPEQNSAFNDHYLEIDYDLSNVMFVATANSLDIAPALRDRMEIIQLSGYTELEKNAIAKQYLIPRAIKDNGLTKSEISITLKATLDIIRYYTREAGVRNLQQKINTICRKSVKNIMTNEDNKKCSIGIKNLEDYLGIKPFDYGIKKSRS